MGGEGVGHGLSREEGGCGMHSGYPPSDGEADGRRVLVGQLKSHDPDHDP